MFKIMQLGIAGNMYNWIESWLWNRKQRVVINGSALHWVPVTSGVSERFLLRPVLFVICINYIDVGLHNFISILADDTKIVNSVKSVIVWSVLLPTTGTM